MPQEWFQSTFGALKKPTSDGIPRTKSENSIQKPEKPKVSKRKAGSENEIDCVVVSDDDDQDDKLARYQLIDWTKTFKPKEISDLVVHPKKLEELRSWLNNLSYAKVANKILCLEGPTGSAKTSAMNLIAKESGYDVCEWINSTDVETGLLSGYSDNNYQGYVAYENQVEKFKDFLLRTSRYESLFGGGRRLLMVKDLPNTFLTKPDEFHKILHEFSEDGLAPLVFIVTQTSAKSLDVAYKLFPQAFRQQLLIDTITFNSISITMMKRGIKRIVQMIEANSHYKKYFVKPTDAIIDGIIEQCQGDIRNAVLNLNFASQQSNFKISVPKAAKAVKGKKTKASLKATGDGGIGKNEALTLLHGIGRVMNPKSEMDETTKLMKLTHSPETITENFTSQPRNFIEMVHSNYITRFGDIHDLAENTDTFSIADCFDSEYRDAQLHLLNLNLVIRSTMVVNTDPISRFGVSSYANKKWKTNEEASKEKFINSSKSLNNGHIMSQSDFFCDYNSFMSLIKK